MAAVHTALKVVLSLFITTPTLTQPPLSFYGERRAKTGKTDAFVNKELDLNLGHWIRYIKNFNF